MTNPYYAPWTAYAQCREIGDPDLWFPEKGGSAREAVKVCGSCRVRLLCLDAAMTAEAGLARGSRIGIWGGLTPNARAKREPQWLAEQAEEMAA